ncbi:haloacid dehalogenase-like hydrolase [Actinomadura barringtoniae]|uniref:Haloacid dehalogenase-like hydrolase n=1 Tax=Actinomadura barringtoniae TaxID=1427535 RepID=A0A939PGT9_9ACTN|nr:haloacid dehalogenase-like hydrolase [Actinomadura barringtoniae]MBO2448246.1 haloacid dehalogenase-like hydrolase [Actinomadura barringtoniae]
MRTLVLWDIDHTLVSIDGLSREIYADVFAEITGRPTEKVASMAGQTDLAITAETLRHHGITPSPDLIEAFMGALAEAFSSRRHEIKARGRALDGARAVLEALADRTDVIQSVLTGNMKPVAEYKLTAFDLNHLVDFEVGAYGQDAAERPTLVRLAQDRATSKYGETFDAATTVLIGDTPNDVLAGHQGGARVIAVATGSSTKSQLQEAGAELVLNSLTDTDAAVRAILSAGQ